MKQRIQAFGVKRILNYLDANPDENIPKVLDWVEKFDKDKTLVENGPLPTVKRVLSDKESVWYKFVRDLYADVDDEFRKKFFENFMVNSVILGREKKIKMDATFRGRFSWTRLQPAICSVSDAGPPSTDTR